MPNRRIEPSGMQRESFEYTWGTRGNLTQGLGIWGHSTFNVDAGGRCSRKGVSDRIGREWLLHRAQ